MDSTPTTNPPVVDPLADEEKQLPSYQLAEDYKNKTQEDYTKHLAEQIKLSHPDLKDATDEEAFKVVHQVEVPDASPDEYWKVLGKLYGKSYVPPKPPPLVSVTQPSQAGAMAADIPVSLWQDITAIPKGVAELIQGMRKVGEGSLFGVKSLAYGSPVNPSQLTEGVDEVAKAKAHFARGGAFGAGLVAASLTGGALDALPILQRSKYFIPRLVQNAVKGSLDVGSFMGPYSAIREAAKENVHPPDVWNAFMEGTSGGMETGAMIGAGGTIGGTLISAARAAGQATASAKTLAESKAAAAKFANVFQPEWAPPTATPKEFAEGLISELHGPDVASSEAGKRAAKVIEGKIKTYQDNLINTAFLEQPKPVTPFSAPRELETKGQVLTPNGPIWTVAIQTEPGQIEIHSVTAKNAEDAMQLSQQKAGELSGTVLNVEPQIERRGLERRILPSTLEQERRLTERRNLSTDDVSFLKEAANRAQDDISTIEKSSSTELIRRWQDRFPDKPVPADTEDIRNQFRREAQAQLQGSNSVLRSTMDMEVPKAQLEVASPSEITKAIVNPNFADEFARLKDSGASDAEISNILQRSLEDRYGPWISKQETPEGRVSAGYDPSLLKKLAAKMYQGTLSRIVPKELLQNSIDSIRGMENGRIKMELNAATTSIGDHSARIIDNGSGMSPETVKRELVDLGSSLKPAGSSGGFGLAKAALFSSAKEINIKTVAEVSKGLLSKMKKVETTLTGSGEDWADPKKGLKFETREVSPETPTGTDIQLIYPQKDSEGNATKWDVWGLENFAKNFDLHNFSGIPVDFRINGQPGLTSGVKWSPVHKIETPAATLTFYTGGTERATSYIDAMILNRGIPQFTVAIPAFQTPSPILPDNIAVDISAKVPVDSNLYPFTTSREDISRDLREMITRYLVDDLGLVGIKKEQALFMKSLNDAPKIGSTEFRLLDPTMKRDPDLMNDIMKSQGYGNLSDDIYKITNKMQEILGKVHQMYGAANFFGLSTGQDHLGINISGPMSLGTPYNLILINPWTIMDEVQARIRNKITDDTPEEITKDFAWQIVSTMQHELSHQLQRGHDVSFAGHLTRNIGVIGDTSTHLAEYILKGIKNNGYELINSLKSHAIKLQIDAAKNEGQNIFAKISDSAAGNGSSGPNKGTSGIRQTGRSESETSIPPRGKNQASGIPSSTEGRRDFSSIIDKARNYHKIPVKRMTAQEAEMNPVDYLPVQEFGKEEIPVE